MVHAKNYETVSTFVKVIQKKLWSLFFLDTVYNTFNYTKRATEQTDTDRV